MGSTMKIKIIAPPERKYSVWIGGSIHRPQKMLLNAVPLHCSRSLFPLQVALDITFLSITYFCLLFFLFFLYLFSLTSSSYSKGSKSLSNAQKSSETFYVGVVAGNWSGNNNIFVYYLIEIKPKT